MRAPITAGALLGAAFFVGTFVSPGGAAESPAAAGPKPEAGHRTREQTLQMMVDDQQKEIVRLRAENDRLRKQVADLKTRELIFAPPALLPPPRTAESATPKGAVPHEFNGETYYVIPLKSDDADAAKVVPAK
jgi:hypothetical protein